MGPSELYVGAVHRLRQAVERRGGLERLEAISRAPLRHVRTLFAVYDAEGLSHLGLPSWSCAAIRRARPEAKGFGFGAGASTTWLARRPGTVIAVDHDTEFAVSVAVDRRPWQRNAVEGSSGAGLRGGAAHTVSAAWA